MSIVLTDPYSSVFESQRDSIIQPSVATQELRWGNRHRVINPERVEFDRAGPIGHRSGFAATLSGLDGLSDA